MINRKSILLGLLLSLSTMATVCAKEIQTDAPILSRKQLAVGLFPAVTYEPWDGKDRLDINVLPLDIQWSLTEYVSFRGRSIANLRWENQSLVGLSNLGLEVSLPVYWGPKKATDWYDLFYIAPLIGGGIDITDQSKNLTIGAELGYLFLFSETLALNVGIQQGASFIFGFADDPIWHHQGLMVTMNYLFDL